MSNRYIKYHYMFWKHTSYCNWDEIQFSVKLYFSGHRLRLQTSIPQSTVVSVT